MHDTDLAKVNGALGMTRVAGAILGAFKFINFTKAESGQWSSNFFVRSCLILFPSFIFSSCCSVRGVNSVANFLIDFGSL